MHDKLVHKYGTDAVSHEGANMVKKIMNIALLFSLFLCQMIMLAMAANGEEQKLSLKCKIRAIEQIKKNYPIAGFALSIADVNNDKKNEIVVSGNGYMRLLEWNGTTFERKWTSPQYSYPLGFGNATFPDISRLVPVKYFAGKEFAIDYLYFGFTTAKSSDIYKLIWKQNNYETQKISSSPFNWFDLIGACGDGSSVVVGSKQHEKGNYIVVYKWNGAALVEKWRGVPSTDIKVTGEILTNSNNAENVFLVRDNKRTGLLSCVNDKFEWKMIDIDAGMRDLLQKNHVGSTNSAIGFTKKGSVGELWTIQGSDSDYEYNAKLYVSQFDGKKFLPLARVLFKGVDSSMIFKMIIADVDNDGVGEILGVEEKIRKTIPRNNPGDTGEEGDTLLITTNLFLAKWNGKEYEIKWHKKAIDERVSNIAVGDVTGDGNKEILITDENGYLYVFDMPTDK